jgi:hypothetical protein
VQGSKCSFEDNIQSSITNDRITRPLINIRKGMNGTIRAMTKIPLAVLMVLNASSGCSKFSVMPSGGGAAPSIKVIGQDDGYWLQQQKA